ncbi:MFS transporter [Sphingomonas jatrophae]|uniref:Sugar phosphate permease n=1 Tax=Sphingomonas jatrophae TaxID=1166337 RepID=A0A1I6K989_9SPHN|nr:MFS transporter [Sphingomonas jatrophae]SFR87440.1 Sugar phosphate permease [Sphingomonas jatrophae]
MDGRTAPRDRYPWLLIGLLWIVSFLNAADRSVIVAVMPSIRDEFGLSPTQLALVPAVFFWVYAVAALFTGRLGDSARRTRVVIYGLVFWSLATGLVPLSTGFVMLLATRAIVAAGESTYYPTATALIGDWHRTATRSRALSIHQTAVFAGSGLGALMAGAIADHLGWRAPFLIFAALGVIWAVALIRLLRDAPIRHTAAEAGRTQEPYGIVLGIKPAIMLFAVFFLANGVANGVTVWAPTFVHDMLGESLAGSALYGSASINIAGFFAVPLGGLLADWLAKQTPIGRFYTLAIGLAVAALLLLPMAWATSGAQVGLVLIGTTLGKGLFDGCIYAAMQDVVPPHARSTAVGMMTTCGFLGAGLAPLFIAQAAGALGMAGALASLAALYALAVLLLLATRGMTARAVAANAEVTA